MTIRQAIGAIVFVVLAASGFGDAHERLTLHVTPLESFAPARLFIRITVDPSAENRGLEVEAVSERFYRSSFVQLDGDRGPRTTSLEWPSVPGGTYEINAAVTDDDGRRLEVARKEVVVIDR